MDPIEQFESEAKANIDRLGQDQGIRKASLDWIQKAGQFKWAYNFSWLGRPAIQFPNDAWALQEIIWRSRPSLIIETGIAHGGSLVFSASMLALLDIADAIAGARTIDPSVSSRKVLGIDIDIRAHNRAAIEAHPMASRISMIQGSSTAAEIVEEVHNFSRSFDRVMICLDSNHTHDHVLKELESYASLTSKECYCIVFDTAIEDMPRDSYPDRPWGRGNSPKTAVWEFLKRHPEFKIDNSIADKLQITVAPDGFLRRIG
jgi:cephalosporin hydroxylase